MAGFTAKDVKKLRDATGAGMLDAKRALSDNEGDFDAAARWLREKGLGKAVERAGRDSSDGAIAVARSGSAAGLVELKSETDFVAKSAELVRLVREMAAAVAADGEDAVSKWADAVDDLRLSSKENVQLGRVLRFEGAPGNVLGTYLHVQNGRGVNGVLVELAGGSDDLAHEVALHIAFGRPSYLRREEVPASEVEAERAIAEAEARNQGKPEQAIRKVLEGKVAGWYRRVPGGVLLEQPFARDDKRTVSDLLGDASVVRFAQAAIGG